MPIYHESERIRITRTVGTACFAIDSAQISLTVFSDTVRRPEEMKETLRKCKARDEVALLLKERNAPSR